MALLSAQVAFILVLFTCQQSKDTEKNDSFRELDVAYRKFEKAFTIGTEKDWIKAIRSFDPTRTEMDILFPKHGERAWNQYLKRRVSEEEIQMEAQAIAKDAKKYGAIKEVRIDSALQHPQIGANTKAFWQ